MPYELKLILAIAGTIFAFITTIKLTKLANKTIIKTLEEYRLWRRK